MLIDSKMHFMGSNEVAEKWQPALSEWHVNKEISEEQLPFARNVKQIIDSGKQDEFFMPYEDRIIKNSVKFFYKRKLQESDTMWRWWMIRKNRTISR